MQVAVQMGQPFLNPFLVKQLEVTPMLYLGLIAAGFGAKSLALPLLGMYAKRRGARSLLAPGVPFLDRMGITFAGVVLLMLAITACKPLAAPLPMPENPTMDMRPSRVAQWAGAAVIVVILSIYIVFR